MQSHNSTSNIYSSVNDTILLQVLVGLTFFSTGCLLCFSIVFVFSRKEFLEKSMTLDNYLNREILSRLNILMKSNDLCSDTIQNKLHQISSLSETCSFIRSKINDSSLNVEKMRKNLTDSIVFRLDKHNESTKTNILNFLDQVRDQINTSMHNNHLQLVNKNEEYTKEKNAKLRGIIRKDIKTLFEEIIEGNKITSSNCQDNNNVTCLITELKRFVECDIFVLLKKIDEHSEIEKQYDHKRLIGQEIPNIQGKLDNIESLLKDPYFDTCKNEESRLKYANDFLDEMHENQKKRLEISELF
jgi:hypothetical protein